MATTIHFRNRDWVTIGILTLLFFLLDAWILFDQAPIIPVRDAQVKDWRKDSFWHPSWGESGIHKGIDIFARKGTSVLAAVSGLVLFSGHIKLGGNAITILDPKWRLHYFAHLDSIVVQPGDWVHQGNIVGTVGDTGNAKGRPVHLHYSVMSLIPYPAHYSDQPEGWKLMFYLNPDHFLRRQ